MSLIFKKAGLNLFFSIPPPLSAVHYGLVYPIRESSDKLPNKFCLVWVKKFQNEEFLSVYSIKTDYFATHFSLLFTKNNLKRYARELHDKFFIKSTAEVFGINIKKTKPGQ